MKADPTPFPVPSVCLALFDLEIKSCFPLHLYSVQILLLGYVS